MRSAGLRGHTHLNFYVIHLEGISILIFLFCGGWESYDKKRVKLEFLMVCRGECIYVEVYGKISTIWILFLFSWNPTHLISFIYFFIRKNRLDFSYMFDTFRPEITVYSQSDNTTTTTVTLKKPKQFIIHTIQIDYTVIHPWRRYFHSLIQFLIPSHSLPWGPHLHETLRLFSSPVAGDREPRRW